MVLSCLESDEEFERLLNETYGPKKPVHKEVVMEEEEESGEEESDIQVENQDFCGVCKVG
jgi:hypothetical protein